MTKQVQRRRGTSTQHTSFTGAEGEISVNTTNKSIHVHDGVTAGGVEAARADLTNVSDANLNAALSGNTLSSLTITSVDINGGTIDGAVIGGSSAAAGTFTTVTASGDLTIADKIVHSGDTDTSIRFPAADTVTVETGGAERLRVDANGSVGIATISPGARLDVSGASGGIVYVRGTGDAYQEIAGGGRTPGTGSVLVGQGNSGEGYLWNRLNSFLSFGTNATERMRIDASGNVGIGTTSPAGKLHVAGSVVIGNANAYNELVFSGTEYTNLYSETTSGFDIGTNSTSGSSYLRLLTENTERARIDASGNLLVGATSTVDSSKLYVVGGISQSGTQFNFRPGSGVQYELVNRSGAGFDFYVNNATNLAARIDSSGNLLVGTTAQNGRVTIVGSAASSKPLALDSNASYAEIQSYNSGPLYLNRQGNDVIVNSGGGNLLVGTTSQFGSPGSNGSLAVLADGSNYAITTKVPLTASYGQFGFYNPNGVVGSITTSSSSTAYNTSSDYRLKENVQPMTGALDKIAQLNPVTYTWKADGSAGQGFIAHELQAVVPDCVAGEKDAVDAEGNPQYQGVDTSFLVATLVKAIQELKAEVDGLRAQLNP